MFFFKKALKKTISTALALLLLSHQCLAYGSIPNEKSEASDAIFSFNEADIYQAFAAIEPFTDALGSMENNALDILIPANIQPTASLPINNEDDVRDTTRPLGIPSFLWGCAFGIWGVVLVYIVSDKNHDEAQKALKGCMVSNGFIIVAYAAFMIFMATTATSSPYYYSTY